MERAVRVISYMSCILLIISLSCVVFIQNDNLNKNKIVLNKNNDEINNLKYLLDLKDTLSLYQFYFDDFNVKEYLFSKIETDTINSELKEHLNNLPKFIFYYSEIDCNSCVEDFVSIINEFKDKISEENMIYFSSYKNKDDMYMFKRINKIHVPIFNLRGHEIFQKRLNVPFCFVIDKNGYSDCIYFPAKDNINVIRKYMNHIIKKHFNVI
ncbi:hypothetical protein FACS1894174_00650 [Bacteroidia bacterium]|nr:hypothetical protein FACS1894174_00650 [Bacteroidia bacterium]